MSIKITNFLANIIDKISENNMITSDVSLKSNVVMPYRVAWYTILIFFGIFGVWATFAPMESTIIVPGILVNQNYNRYTVQHLEGGIVQEIFVQDGDRVRSGDPLVKIQDVKIVTQIQSLKEKFNLLTATVNRLNAEHNNLDEIVYSENIISNLDNISLQETVHTQNTLFNERRSALNTQTEILDNQIQQILNEINALNYQLEALEEHYIIIQEDLKAKQELFERDYINKPILTQIQKEEVSIRAKIGEYRTNISKAYQKIDEKELEKNRVFQSFYSSVSNELKALITEIEEVNNMIISATDVLDRTLIIAPIDGIISDMQVKNLYNVITPATTILEIVPETTELIVEGHLLPNDIDHLLSSMNNPKQQITQNDHSGLKTNIRITTFNAKTTPPIVGITNYVSANVVSEGYYITRTIIPTDEVKKLKNARLYPGMPVMIYISSGSRTLLQYLLSPISQLVNNGLKER
ncbi:MAG: type I secretion membrane fusion, HlyD family protein [Candidatus Xenolissoclinum pacificiensis L6]|uniref:Membrane fusion protein (MFP) family protein n=1 Tax=Candidatus Xenolissoclinum pacificiensis L6 TaxID=1401685 RepID=W2V0I9_9RICK|nr:MAG: type I secretion membrane fusion, HlyD family protein [Candidatus Xenolissoclinum pacificiensis L6]